MPSSVAGEAAWPSSACPRRPSSMHPGAVSTRCTTSAHGRRATRRTRVCRAAHTPHRRRHSRDTKQSYSPPRTHPGAVSIPGSKRLSPTRNELPIASATGVGVDRAVALERLREPRADEPGRASDQHGCHGLKFAVERDRRKRGEPKPRALRRSETQQTARECVHDPGLIVESGSHTLAQQRDEVVAHVWWRLSLERGMGRVGNLGAHAVWSGRLSRVSAIANEGLALPPRWS